MIKTNEQLPPSLAPFVLPPSQIPPHYALEVVRCRRECCTGSLYNCKESNESTVHHSTVPPSQWEDSARLSAAAAAAAAVAAIYCNYLRALMELATVELL